MIVAVHKHEDGRLFIAICDEDLIGKKFEEDEKRLDLTSEYYIGKKMNKEQAWKIANLSYMTSFIGKEAVALGLEKGVVLKEKVITIQGIPTGQMLRL